MDSPDINTISVIGAGLMGHGIALQFATFGYDVWLNDLSDDRLQEGMANFHSNLATLQSVGLIDKEAAASVPSRVRTSTSIKESVADAGFVIEAVFEDLNLKRQVFTQLDELSPAHAILASNTSSFMSSQIASATERPDKVVVANWWNPPYLLPLVEVVKGPATSEKTIETTKGLLEKVGKTPIVLQKESLGFIGNRMQFALLREAISIVQQGIASPSDVDTVVKNSFGRRLAVAGPLEVFDIAGWDTILAIVEQLFPHIESSPETPSIISDMVDRGNLGVKSGKGFYSWNDDSISALKQRVGQALASIEQLSREF